MTKHEFTLILKGQLELTEEIADELRHDTAGHRVLAENSLGSAGTLFEIGSGEKERTE